MTPAQLADAARALVGTPFRLHGRDPHKGLDCVGVLAAALGRTDALPNGYCLRSRTRPATDAFAAELGLIPAEEPVMPGDVVLLRPAICQWHLAIATGAGMIVHAHAGLRKVVHGPLPADWPIAGHWRFAASRT